MHEENQDQYPSLKVTLRAETVNPDPNGVHPYISVSLKACQYIDKPSEEILTKLCNDVIWFLTFHEASHVANYERTDFMNRRKREIIASLRLDTNDYKNEE